MRSLVASVALSAICATAGRGRGLARVARPEPRRRLERDRAAEPLVVRRGEPRLEGALRRRARRRRSSATGSTSSTGAPTRRRSRQRSRSACSASTPTRASSSGRSASTSSIRTHPRTASAWASPSVDPATGNVYAFGVNEHLHALDPSGKLLWERQLTEEFGAISTHGAPHGLARDRGRPRDRQHAQLGLGRPVARHEPLLRLRQEGRRGRLDQLAAAEALRHQLLDADRAHRRRPPAARGRGQRRHVLRARGHHRRARSGSSR